MASEVTFKDSPTPGDASPQVIPVENTSTASIGARSPRRWVEGLRQRHKQKEQQRPGPVQRVHRYQTLWGRIGERLPPQISRRHISVISVGGVIGTGVFVGVSTSLRHAGPVGSTIAYTVTGTIVWSVVISIGEVVAWLPNVGGPVGLASLYVDPALGFALGWNAWYNWAIILPTELSAAALILGGLFPTKGTRGIYAIISIFLSLSACINFLGARVFGEVEFVLSLLKIVTMFGLVILGLAIDGGAGALGHIGFKNWTTPGPFVYYRNIHSGFGAFLGVWTVMMQSCFSYFGTEVAAIAAGEVVNPHRNIPKAVKRVWLRIFLFYVASVFVAGLLVRSDDCRLGPSQPNMTCYPGPSSNENNNSTASSSPFIIAIRDAQLGKGVEDLVTIAFALSAWSAATSDIYMSSRFLFFLAECGQAPPILRRIMRVRRLKLTVPYVCVMVSCLVGLLAYMSASEGPTGSTMYSQAAEVFKWFSSMTSATALLSWIGMMFTYLRWYYGSRYQERLDPKFKETHPEVYENRQIWQPWPAWYALISCTMIMMCNGWFVFTQKSEPWRISQGVNEPPVQPNADPDIGPFVPTFISSYLPIPFFLLCIFGYKLVYRSRMVPFSEMAWNRGEVPPIIVSHHGDSWWWRALDALF
ncbi:hypothetical protein SISSUDRAFT_1045524 [Sistotremastrum suecicum HHB10207 ss-3]|uniref:Amino acid permease/ SLC12A domain-containing protein n=1 Tax=Sistotremastrum suecicum HHB10207 ss-3 TaxID=1314776 RepID=A0A166EEB0_9AGAM|nr:hypothetical protein SISSUDRAFT_1045524 [Sistotremastrum suecicum HHB10207 ss-3]